MTLRPLTRILLGLALIAAVALPAGYYATTHELGATAHQFMAGKQVTWPPPPKRGNADAPLGSGPIAAAIDTGRTAGIALLALGATGDKPGSALVIGIAAVVAAVVCFWAVRDSSDSRVLAPVVRLWPLVLIVAGVLIYRRAKSERVGASYGAAPTVDTPDSGEKPDNPQG